MILSITLFFVIILGLGYTILSLSKIKSGESIFEYIFAMLAVGFAATSFLGVILNVLHIPIHISVYTLLALLYPLWKSNDIKLESINFKRLLKPNLFAIFIILIALVQLYVYATGAMNYPYLEDDDPWAHASAAQYVAIHKTYTIGDNVRFSPYIEPYPPTYDVIMGVMKQTNDSINWTLKFFNSLMVALSLIFFYMFVKELLHSRWIALLSSLVLLVMPSFMSHFIWSHTLAVTLIFPALYCVLRGIKHKRWMIPAIICIASMMVSHQFVSVLFGILFVFLLLVHLVYDIFRFKFCNDKIHWVDSTRIFMMGVYGVALSMVYWIEQVVKYGMGVITMRSGEFAVGQGWMSAYALQKYSLSDLMNPSIYSKIDQATGFGFIVSILAVLGVIYMCMKIDKKRSFLLLFGGFTFFMLMSATWNMPIPGVSRAWAYASIPIAIFAGATLFALYNKFSKWVGLFVVISLVALLMFNPGFKYKYEMQTSQWPPGAMWKSPQELQGYMTLPQLPVGTRVLPLCKNNDLAIGMDMMNDFWTAEEREFLVTLENQSVDSINAHLRKGNYEYFIIDASCIDIFGNSTVINNLIVELFKKNKLEWNNEHYFLMKVN